MKVNPITVSVINSTGYNDQILPERNKKEGTTLNRFYTSREDDLSVIVRHNKRLLVHYYQTWRVLWEVFITITVIYICIIIPLFTAFYPLFLANPGFITVEIIISIIYFFDILINFRTTYIDNVTLMEETDSTKILKDYGFSIRIIFDAISCVPFEIFVVPEYGLLRLLKIYKFFRLTNLITVMRIPQIIKLIMKFLIVLGFLVIFIHFTACVFFLMIDRDHTWIPPEDYPTQHTDFFERSQSEQYWASIYHSVYFITGIKNGGETTEQIIFFCFFYIVGAILTAVLLGNMTFLIRNARRDDTLFNETYSTLSTSMRNLKLPSSLRYKITEFFTANYNILKHNREYLKFIEKLPPSLVKKINKKALASIIEKNKLFQSFPKVLKFALVRLQCIFYQPGMHILTQFDRPTNLYFISKGQCNVEVVDEQKKIHLVNQLDEGDHFGEISMLFNTECTATVSTVSYASLAFLNPENFQEMLDVFPDIKKLLLNKVSKYKDHWRIFIKNMIRRVPYFYKLDQNLLSLIMYSLEQVRYDSGEIFFEEGKKTDSIFFILEGDVEAFTYIHDRAASCLMISKTSSDTEDSLNTMILLTLASIPMGSCIFPNIFLSQSEAMISLRALSHVHMLKLTMPILEQHLINYISASENIQKYKETLFYYDNLINEKIPLRIPLDIIKNHKYSNGIPKRQWKVCQKFKNAVLKIINTKRKLRIKNNLITKRVVKKLKAMKFAESIGKTDLVRQIANDEVSEDIVKILHLVDDEEIGNELLRQFALKANETFVVAEFLSGRIKSCRKKVRKLKHSYEEINHLAMAVEKLLLEAIKISKAA